MSKKICCAALLSTLNQAQAAPRLPIEEVSSAAQELSYYHSELAETPTLTNSSGLPSQPEDNAATVHLRLLVDAGTCTSSEFAARFDLQPQTGDGAMHAHLVLLELWKQTLSGFDPFSPCSLEAIQKQIDLRYRVSRYDNLPNSKWILELSDKQAVEVSYQSPEGWRVTRSGR